MKMGWRWADVTLYLVMDHLKLHRVVKSTVNEQRVSNPLHTCGLLKLNLTTAVGDDSSLYAERSRDSFSLVYSSLTDVLTSSASPGRLVDRPCVGLVTVQCTQFVEQMTLTESVFIQINSPRYLQKFGI